MRARAARLQTHDLLDWVDASIYNIGRGMSEYRKNHPPEIAEGMLDLAINETDVLAALLEEIQSRTKF